jgi:hypothetical protein
MPQDQNSAAAPSAGGPIRPAAAEIGELVIAVIAVTAALLVDLAIFAFMSSH